MNRAKKICWAIALSFSLLAMWLLPLGASVPIYAVSVDHPVQLMNIAVKDNSKVLTETGINDGSALSAKALGNTLAPSWRFDRVGVDSNGTFFKICNAESGRLLTPQNYKTTAGTNVVVYGSESAQSQHWYAVPVKSDHLGNNLYYKIVNYSNISLALTWNNSGMTLENYTEADNQLWLLNADGLQGFAGYCTNDNTKNIKAGNIGGLFGETVEVSTFADLKKYAEADKPYTIVVTKNIKVTELNMNGTRYMCSAGRIYVRSNKTIIGSYNSHTLFNVQFCTASKNGKGDNIIIRNFDMQHDAESNNNDSIVCYFGSGENIWVDHVTFTGHDNYGYAPQTKLVDEDKFLACCYDADYCTVSDCSFGKHKYGLILGYPSDDASNKTKYGGCPRMSLISNKSDGCSTRSPGLMRWGYFHSLNNYINNFSMAYTVMSDANIYAENCVYENGGNVICDWDKASYIGHYTETGSTFSGCKRTQQGGDSNSTADASSWRPNSNYSYVKLSADKAKTYCTSSSGCQTSKNNVTYLRFAKKGVPSAGYTELPNASVNPTTPTEPPIPTEPVITPESFANGSAWRFKNVNSGLYMQVDGAKAQNSVNVQQWGSDGASSHDVWKMFSAGNGYYYLASCVGDGGTYVLDVSGKKASNGTNIDIYQYNGGSNQQFMLTKNGDGSYKIRTRITNNKSAVEVVNASKESGANVQQYEVNGANCQDWILEAAVDPGCKMDTNLIYTFENVDSGLVMDIENGLMKDNTNVQQYSSNNNDCQKWTLKAFGSGNYYYIRSLQNNNYVLKSEGNGNSSNIDIMTYSNKDSAMLFRFTKNLDGSFNIVTHASKDTCIIEVVNASKNNGANVQQWQPTYNDCQKWNLKTETTTAPITVTTPTTTKVIPETTTAPTTTPTSIPGDVNDDGKFTITDVLLLQKWILAVPNTKLPNWQAADLNNDDCLNVFDCLLMKRLLLHNK